MHRFHLMGKILTGVVDNLFAGAPICNVNRIRIENLMHRIFDAARLDIVIKDRFGQPVIPREWFLVPLFAIDDAVERIRDGSVTGYVYDPKAAALRLDGT